MVHLSVGCCGRFDISAPCSWKVVTFRAAIGGPKRQHQDVMLIAARGVANHDLMSWLLSSGWHYCLRLPCDLLLHGPRRSPIEVRYLWPPQGEAVFDRHVGLWQDGAIRGHIV